MTDWKHELGQEYLALLEGGELGREAYRAGQIAKAEELGRMDARATQGTASLYEQVQHALFGARFWVSRARIKKAMHPIELMSTMLEHHHGGDSERAVSGWHQAIRAAASAGQIIPRDAVSLMPLPVLPVGDDWLLTLPDADKFLEPLGWAVSDYLVHVFDDCFPTAAPEQTATPGPEVASEGTAPAVPNWKMRVQTEATELFIRLLASGANPTQHSILDSMVTWCCNHEIKTDGKNGGINPSRGYLRTHVLGGGHWTPPTMSREQAKKHVAQVAQTKVAQVAQQHT